jgi:hypothetical protein
MIQQQQGPTGPGSQEDRETSGVRHQVRGAADDVAREAQEVGRTVRDEAASLAGAAKHELKTQAESGKDQIADRLSSVADRLHRSADDLRGDEAWLADMLDEGVRQLGGLADGLKRRDLGSLVGSIETFARRQPALFAGASVALGFAAARLAKASAERNRGSYQGRAETGFPGGSYGGGAEYSGASSSGATSSGGSGMGAHGAATGGMSGTGGAALGAGTRDFATSDPYSASRTSHTLHEDQPGAAGHDRAATSERWRSPDLPIGDPGTGPKTTGPVTGSGTGVTP